MSRLQNLRKELESFSNKERANILQRFFKTGKGQYGEGDLFLGITVPQSRKIAKKYSDICFDEIKSLLESRIHEERLTALLILVDKYEKDIPKRKDIFDFYINNTQYVNNWDLVDLSADKIVGKFLFNWKYDEYFSILSNLAMSNNVWERRIAIISTFFFIKNKQFYLTFKIAETLLKDEHDLIHKAVGWMLREIGKRNKNAEEDFLKQHYKKIPRIMLRYAIERFPENIRRSYLRGEV